MSKIGLTDLEKIAERASGQFEDVLSATRKVMSVTNFNFSSLADCTKYLDEIVYLEGDLVTFILECTNSAFSLSALARTVEGPSMAMDNVKKNIVSLKMDFDSLANNAKTSLSAVRSRREYVSRLNEFIK